MLVLSRKVDEAILINGDIKIVVSRIQAGKVRLAVEAPKDVPILRQELTPRLDVNRVVENCV